METFRVTLEELAHGAIKGIPMTNEEYQTVYFLTERYPGQVVIARGMDEPLMIQCGTSLCFYCDREGRLIPIDPNR